MGFLRSYFRAFLSFFLLLEIKGAIREEVKAIAGSEVTLPCAIQHQKCGDFHSIKWYKENRRVFVYSPHADFAKAEGELIERGQLIIDENYSNARLRLTELKISDEGEYKCEITFLDITKNCPVVQLVKLTTLAEPKFINISFPEGKDVSNSVIGPYPEGHELRLLCLSGGGKPSASVNWYNGTTLISGKASNTEEEDGSGIGANEIKVTLSRNDLGHRLSCKAENEALALPLFSFVQPDIHLRPLETKVLGAEAPILEGQEVNLICQSVGARPAAFITWFNGSRPWNENPGGHQTSVSQKSPVEVTAKQDDSTYETQSRVSFIATRFENGQYVTCEATNDVLKSYSKDPQRSSVPLTIHYSPVVTISPHNNSVNEFKEIAINVHYEANPRELTAVHWYKNGQFLDVSNRSKYHELNLESPSLIFISASRTDSGFYSVVLENKVGPSESLENVRLDVYYKPKVSLRMEPQSPISELEEKNVTLFCEVISGNPLGLKSVKWFMDGEILKELPDCQKDGSLCDIDPSKLLLEKVSRAFHGNFSCQGLNDAGWSEVSDEKELQIYYPPGQAFIQKNAEEVIKNGAVTLTCGVSEKGRPTVSKYIWKRGGHVMREISSFNWTIDPVTLETESNISCVAVNEIGSGEEDVISLLVYAPPSFISRLPPYSGSLATEDFNLSCQVECSPLCDILWFKDGSPILETNENFLIVKETFEANSAKNDFESIRSTLSWNLETWPSGALHRDSDNGNFTCQSTENMVGQSSVSSVTYFKVEYPPENIQVSKEVQSIEEGSTFNKILCSADAYPEPTYLWKFKEEIVSHENNLVFDYGVSRHQAGEYVCTAHNRHGDIQRASFIDVLYKPECSIEQNNDENSIILVCKATGNPQVYDFNWRKSNESLESVFETKGSHSKLYLKASPESFGTYICVVNNSLGEGPLCDIHVSALGLFKSTDSNFLLILGATIASLLVFLIIFLLLIFLICRRRRRRRSQKSKDKQYVENDNRSPERDDGTFYENVPFHRGAPTKKLTLDHKSSEFEPLDYADADYKNLYDYGPVTYMQSSQEAALAKKTQELLIRGLGEKIQG